MSLLQIIAFLPIIASVGACTIELNAESPVGMPSYNGEEATRTYSCTADSTCNYYDVHVLSCYEARSDHWFNYHPTGHSTVDISATGQSSRPIVLVLVSYEPIEWTLNIPSQIVIDTVIVTSYHNSNVSYTHGRVRSVERPSRGTIPRGYGEDSGGGDTVGLLQYLENRFGDVASFSGTYRANRWRVDMIFQEGCDTTPDRPTLEPVQTQVIACPLEDYCEHTIEAGAVCVDGFCQCPHSRVYDSCSCLPSIASCTIRLNAANPVGVPSYTGSSGIDRIYSCVSNANCNYDVHVLSCYEARSSGFRQHPTGHSTVDVSATGQSSRPIVLVLVSYEPIEWTLNIPSQIVIDTVIVISYYSSSVSYSPGRVRSVERPSRGEIPRGYGEDSGGGDTVGLLQYLENRFGDVASFSGTYRADRWRVDMILHEGCDPSPTKIASCFNPLPTKDVSSNSAQTSSSISPGVIAGVAIVVVIGTVAVIFVVCVYIVRKSRGSIPAAHHSAPEPSSLHYPRQQGVTYHTHSDQQPALAVELVKSQSSIPVKSELLMEAPPAYPAMHCTTITSGKGQSTIYDQHPPPYPGTGETI